jgi:Kinesin-associated protein (KAP)
MDEACANLFCKAEVLQDLIELLKGEFNANGRNEDNLDI